MPQRARDRSALASPHPADQARATRALQVARQQLEHPRDRHRSKGLLGCTCGCASAAPSRCTCRIADPVHFHSGSILMIVDCDRYTHEPVGEFRRSRGGRPLELKSDDMRRWTVSELQYFGVYGDGKYDGPEREKRHPGSTGVDLLAIAKPGKGRRGVPKGYELVQRPREVIVLDDDDEAEGEWEDDFELVDMPARGKRKGRTFAQAVKGKGKRRER
ncbi:hypothetical protein DACRYDRAFT_25070 [Dacryopinax primogenitus]|uniref:Uncharacterized protein n=1 Tax=Dacryopinax primogenitus (strain DJM 731) TaxID=1858805 RepID=M5FNN4_DACPD|nr:uncharacterized protein DACRYDRAFT_25070 [Dacryopinax primogenitus]EJT97725.1 hypothetical protein DACRYDRAFT_25070 [Dacryopinax primogenitus]